MTITEFLLFLAVLLIVGWFVSIRQSLKETNRWMARQTEILEDIKESLSEIKFHAEGIHSRIPQPEDDSIPLSDEELKEIENYEKE
jgi:hypothetical protein